MAVRENDVTDFLYLVLVGREPDLAGAKKSPTARTRTWDLAASKAAPGARDAQAVGSPLLILSFDILLRAHRRRSDPSDRRESL